MNIKKFSVGTWISCVAAVLSLAAVIAYGLNVSGAGYFNNASVTNLVLFNVLAVVALAAAVVMGMLKLSGAANTGVELASGLLQIIAPVLLAFCLINLIAARAQGLAFIYLANDDVKLEVQTAANLSSATGTIVNIVCLAIAMIASVVGAFFSPRSKA